MFSKRIFLATILSLVSATSALAFELKEKVKLNFISSDIELSDAAYGTSRVREQLTDTAQALHMWYEVGNDGKLSFYILTDRPVQAGSATKAEITDGKIHINGENLTALSVLARYNYVSEVTLGIGYGSDGKSLNLKNVRLKNGQSLGFESFAEFQRKGMVRTEPRVEIMESMARLIFSDEEIKALGLDQSLLELDKSKVGTRQEKYLDLEKLTVELDILRAGKTTK